MTEARRRLRDLIGADRVDLDRLTDAEVSALVAGIERARQQQDAALVAGLEATLGALPRVLRAPARKLVLG